MDTFPIEAARSERKVVELEILIGSSPLNLTTYSSGDLTAYFGTLGSAPIGTYTIGAGITIVTAASGILQIAFAAADLDQSPGRYSWSLWDLKSPNVRRLTGGPFAIVDDLRASVP